MELYTCSWVWIITSMEKLHTLTINVTRFEKRVSQIYEQIVLSGPLIFTNQWHNRGSNTRQYNLCIVLLLSCLKLTHLSIHVHGLCFFKLFVNNTAFGLCPGPCLPRRKTLTSLFSEGESPYLKELADTKHNIPGSCIRLLTCIGKGND